MADDLFLGFDAEIENDQEQEFITLPEGDYNFMVQDWEKAIYNGDSAKIGHGCPMVIVKLVLFSDKGNAFVQDRLYMNKNLEWKLSSFFRAIGMKKHGQKFKMDFAAAIGKEGRCHIKLTQGKDGDKMFMNVDKYLDSEASKAPTKPDMSDMPFEV